MGKLALQLFETNNLAESGVLKALIFFHANPNDFHPRLRAIIPLELRRYLSASSVAFVVGEGNQFTEVKIIDKDAIVKILCKGDTVKIKRRQNPDEAEES